MLCCRALVWYIAGVWFGMLREFRLLCFGGLVCYVAGFGLVCCGGLVWYIVEVWIGPNLTVLFQHTLASWGFARGIVHCVLKKNTFLLLFRIVSNSWQNNTILFRKWQTNYAL